MLRFNWLKNLFLCVLFDSITFLSVSHAFTCSTVRCDSDVIINPAHLTVICRVMTWSSRKNCQVTSSHLPTLHCTVIGFVLDWESHKSLKDKDDRECLTELLERAFFQPYPIQRIQLAEVGWESDNKGLEWKRGWVVFIQSWTTFSVLVWC